jgi:hypothetical protein
MVADDDWFLSLAVSADGMAQELSVNSVIQEALGGAIAWLGDEFRKSRLQGDAK